MALTRPSSDFKNKTNINPVQNRKQEATAEDFQEAASLLEEYATAIEALQVEESPNPFYGRYTSLSILQLTHPQGEDYSWAIIDEGYGVSPKIALWDTDDQTWNIANYTEDRVFVNSYNDLPQPGVEKIMYITKDKNQIYFWYNNTYNKINTEPDETLVKTYQVEGVHFIWRKGRNRTTGAINTGSYMEENDLILYGFAPVNGVFKLITLAEYVSGNPISISSYNIIEAI